VLAVTHPQLFDRIERHVAIETHGRFTRGMTVIDHRHIIERASANCEVLTAVDADGGFELLTDAVAHFSR
jgi:pyrimidine-specific ribonucleoside hydrolase